MKPCETWGRWIRSRQSRKTKPMPSRRATGGLGAGSQENGGNRALPAPRGGPAAAAGVFGLGQGLGDPIQQLPSPRILMPPAATSPRSPRNSVPLQRLILIALLHIFRIWPLTGMCGRGPARGFLGSCGEGGTRAKWREAQAGPPAPQPPWCRPNTTLAMVPAPWRPHLFTDDSATTGTPPESRDGCARCLQRQLASRARQELDHQPAQAIHQGQQG